MAPKQYQIYKCGVKGSEDFKNEFLKNVLLKDWIKNSKYLCINKVDSNCMKLNFNKKKILNTD